MDLPIEILDEEITKLKSKEFSKSNEVIKDLEKSQEDLAFKEKIPEKHIAKKVSLTEIEINLSLVSIARATALKLVKLEKYLSKIEDLIFNDETLNELNKKDLVTLYNNARLMRGELLKSLQDIRNQIDFSTIQAQIEAANIQNERNEITTLDEVVEKILNDENFLKEAMRLNEENIKEIKENK